MKKSRLSAVIIAITMIVASITSVFSDTEPVVSFNQRGLNYEYDQWSTTVKSNLFVDGENIVRVEEIFDEKEEILVEVYGKDLKLKSAKRLNHQQPIYAGAFKYEQDYYLVFGEKNKKENNNKVVITVVKYDCDFNLKGKCEIKGINTVEPFAAGSLRMAAQNGQLYIRTCHKMYKSPDGRNHQANLMIQISTKDMRLVDTHHEISNTGQGYVSHSFNQFILIDDDNNIVGLDHGDAYPRALVIFKYNKKAGEGSFKGTAQSLELVKFAGKNGDNITNATVGGLEEGKNSYLVAGTFGERNNKSLKKQNVVLYIVDKDLKNCKTVKLTNLKNSSKYVNSVPKLVKLSQDRFLIMWQVLIGNGDIGKRLYYVVVDEKGNEIFKSNKTSGSLSECEPVVTGGKALWYSSDLDGLIFQSVKENGEYEREKTFLSKPVYFEAVKSGKKAILYWGQNPYATGYQVFRKTGNGKWIKVAKAGKKANTWTDSKPAKGVKNSYKIRSVIRLEKSPFSDTITLKF